MSLPISDEVAAFERVLRFLKHKRASKLRWEAFGTLYWTSAEMAINEKLGTLRALREKAARSPAAAGRTT